MYMGLFFCNGAVDFTRHFFTFRSTYADIPLHSGIPGLYESLISMNLKITMKYKTYKQNLCSEIYQYTKRAYIQYSLFCK